MKTDVFAIDGRKKSQLDLPKSIFGITDLNHDLIKFSYTLYSDNNRTNNAKTLKRGEVSGGGRKPWKQKGTGRARFGSSRNPIWRHGGIAFGPTGQENYSKGINKKMLKLSLVHSLSLKAKNVILVDSFKLDEYKTSKVADMLEKIDAKGQILIAGLNVDDKFIKSARNIAGVKLIPINQINPSSVLNADSIVIDKDGIEHLVAWLSLDSAKTRGSKEPESKVAKEEIKK